MTGSSLLCVPGVTRLAGCVLALLVSAFGFVSGTFAADSKWVVVKSTADLRVERRPYQGSNLHELRGVTVINASLNSAVALLRDASFNKHWVYRSGGAKILEQQGFARVYVYGIVDAPPPMRDRDTVVRFDYEQNPETRTILIRITNFPGYFPAQDGYVRVPDFGGVWKLEPLGSDAVRVTYQVRGDPGGWVPLWLANYAAEISVIRTLEKMGDVVRQYEGAHSLYVMDGSDPADSTDPAD